MLLSFYSHHIIHFGDYDTRDSVLASVLVLTQKLQLGRPMDCRN